MHLFAPSRNRRWWPRAAVRALRAGRRLAVELLEDRTLLATVSVGSLAASASQIARGSALTLTADGVSGPVAAVNFYLDTNYNGAFDDGTDQQLGQGTQTGDAWTFAAATAALPLGSNRFYARADDGSGNLSAAVASALVNVVNAVPTVGSLAIVSAVPVYQPNNITFEVPDAADADGTVAAVSVYRDANGNGTFDLGTDVLLGQAVHAGDTWRATVSSAFLPAGAATFFARAQDNNGAFSASASTRATVLPQPASNLQWDSQPLPPALRSAMVMGAGGTLHVSYVGYLQASGAFTLMYATRNGAAWVTQVVDTGVDYVASTSIALDSFGNPHIAYGVGEGSQQRPWQMKYASFDGSAWSLETVDPNNTGGWYNTTHLLIDANDVPHISYQPLGVHAVMYAKKSAGQWSTARLTGTKVIVANGSSMALDSHGRPFITYQTLSDLGMAHSNKTSTLSYVKWTGSSWASGVVDSVLSGPHGRYTGFESAVAFDANDTPFISYTGKDYSDAAQTEFTFLRLATPTGNAWQVSDVGFADPYNPLAMALDSHGYPRILYTGTQPPNTGRASFIAYAAWNGRAWALQQLGTLSEPSMGHDCSPALVVDANDNVHAVYPTLDATRHRILQYSVADRGVDLALDQTATFHWAPTAGADHYVFSLADLTTRRNPVLRVSNAAGVAYTLTAAQALTPGHRYKWSLTAVSVAGRALAPVKSQTFSVPTQSAPVTLGPGGRVAAAAGYDRPTFVWSDVPTARRYAVSVVDVATGRVVLSNPNVSGTSWTPAAALTPGHSYKWRVGAVSTNGRLTSWSAFRSFSLARWPRL